MSTLEQLISENKCLKEALEAEKKAHEEDEQGALILLQAAEEEIEELKRQNKAIRKDFNNLTKRFNNK